MSNSSSSQNKMRFKLNSSYDMTQINCIELTFENYLHLWLIPLNCPCLLFFAPFFKSLNLQISKKNMNIKVIAPNSTLVNSKILSIFPEGEK